MSYRHAAALVWWLVAATVCLLFIIGPGDADIAGHVHHPATCERG